MLALTEPVITKGTFEFVPARLLQKLAGPVLIEGKSIETCVLLQLQVFFVRRNQMAPLLQVAHATLPPLQTLPLQRGLGRGFSFEPMRGYLGRPTVGAAGFEIGFLRVIEQ